MEERRRNPRVDASFPVACNMLSTGRYFYTISKNLGLGGVRILYNKFIPRDSALKVNVNLIGRVVSLKAKVVWCNKQRIADRYAAGLEFVEVNKRNQRDISQFLDNLSLA